MIDEDDVPGIEWSTWFVNSEFPAIKKSRMMIRPKPTMADTPRLAVDPPFVEQPAPDPAPAPVPSDNA